MKHSIGYLGHFDRDFQNLRPGPRHYVREDRSLGQVDDRPQDVEGIFFGYLECRGKTFVAVRAQYGDADVILKAPVPLDPPATQMARALVRTHRDSVTTPRHTCWRI